MAISIKAKPVSYLLIAQAVALSLLLDVVIIRKEEQEFTLRESIGGVEAYLYITSLALLTFVGFCSMINHDLKPLISDRRAALGGIIFQVPLIRSILYLEYILIIDNELIELVGYFYIWGLVVISLIIFTILFIDYHDQRNLRKLMRKLTGKQNTK